MRDKKRMWILGSAFILSSGVVYFLFLSAWLNILLFLGFVLWIRIVIGVVALASGGFHIRDYWRNRDGTCKVTNKEKRRTNSRSSSRRNYWRSSSWRSWRSSSRRSCRRRSRRSSSWRSWRRTCRRSYWRSRRSSSWRSWRRTCNWRSCLNSQLIFYFFNILS